MRYFLIPSLTKDLSVEADSDQSLLSPDIHVVRYKNFEAVCPSATQPAATTSSSRNDTCECTLGEKSRVRPSLAILGAAAVLGAVRRISRRRRS